VEDFVREHGYLAVLIALALEGVIGVGLIVPGLTILAAAGFLAGTGTLHPGLVVPTAWAGVFLGDNLSYLLGRFLLNRSARAEVAVSKVRSRWDIERASWWWVFFHFPVITRSTVPIALGASQFAIARWLALSATASLLFTLVFGGLGYVAGRAAGDLGVAERLGGQIQAAFVAICVIGGLVLGWRLWRTRESPESDDPDHERDASR
jgi:membrane protein DedA with SNARE-associated domain